jgi:HlyD family secretion protein
MRLVILAILISLSAGCNGPENESMQGYVEGEYVYVSSSLPGPLKSLRISRGTQVKAGDLLFEFDDTPQRAARDEAERRLANARAVWTDLKKGRRPSEIAAIEAQLKQAKESSIFSESEVARQMKLAAANAGTAEDLERMRATRNQDLQRIAQFEADLATAKLGSREDQVIAAEATVRAQEAALGRAEWDLAQMRQTASKAGVVVDTLYREGEWVAAGKPVVQLLPPENVKVRLFMPEERLGTVRYGKEVRVSVDGIAEPFVGKVSFISPKAEFTPPVIYSREARSKLVFMVEAMFAPEDAAKLHPGQPVDCRFGK